VAKTGDNQHGENLVAKTAETTQNRQEPLKLKIFG